MDELKQLPLHDVWAKAGAKFVPFAGWNMPVQFAGVMAEHLHTRKNAGLFDVSHMGQIIVGDGAAALERLMPVDVAGLEPGRQRYGILTTDTGGVIDDLMIVNRGEDHLLVVNAARLDEDLAHLNAHLDDVRPVKNRALLALQGPKAEAVLSRFMDGVRHMKFMDWGMHEWGEALWVSRSGYTGEDGYEISVPLDMADDFARTLLTEGAVAPIGLGARDSLRLEAGLHLYGQDLSADITPVEAGLKWAIPKVRRRDGDRAGGFPGADVILGQLEDGAPRKRIGLVPEGRAPMRAGVELYTAEDGGDPVGTITSGGFGPSVEKPIAMALVDADLDKDTPLFGELRGKRLPVARARLPFHPHSYKR